MADGTSTGFRSAFTSTVELVRFLTSMGGSRARFLAPATLIEMFAPRRPTVSHMRGGVDWAFLATDATGDKGENAEAAVAITREIDRTRTWPVLDLFERFTRW